jgi:hypothetical protein
MEEAKERRGKREGGGETVMIAGRAERIKRQRVRVMRDRQGEGEGKAEHLLLFRCKLARAPRREGSERAKTNAMVPSSPTELKSRLSVVSSGHLCASVFARWFTGTPLWVCKSVREKVRGVLCCILTLVCVYV